MKLVVAGATRRERERERTEAPGYKNDIAIRRIFSLPFLETGVLTVVVVLSRKEEEGRKEES